MRELSSLSPMLATASELPAKDSGYGFEFKWDGMRALVRVENGKVQAVSRNGNDALSRFPELLGLGKALGKKGAILDGEIVHLDERGRPDFGTLQTRMATHDAGEIARVARAHPAQFLAFDVLALGARDLLKRPYTERREELEALRLGDGPFAAPPYQPGPGSVVLEASRDLGLEGVVAKRLDSPYLPGQRSPHWLKVRNRNRQEFVVGGWTTGEGNRAGTIGSLLLGVYGSPLGPKKLHYVGRVGSGFNDATLARLKAELKAFASDQDPFHPFEDEGDSPPLWVKPKLVCEAEFSGLANHKVLRQAAFKGLREDKPAKDVVWEQADVIPW